MPSVNAVTIARASGPISAHAIFGRPQARRVSREREFRRKLALEPSNVGVDAVRERGDDRAGVGTDLGSRNLRAPTGPARIPRTRIPAEACPRALECRR